MKDSLSRLVTLMMVAVALTACGQISGGLKKVTNGSVVAPGVDFLKSEIVTSGTARADGLSELAVVIHLKNSDNTPVPHYKPLYDFVAGTGVLPGECSTSDINGVSACAVRAIQPGTKRMKLTNARVGLEKDLYFDPALQSPTKLAISSGAVGDSGTAAGYHVKMKVQSSISGADAATDDGYKAKLSLQGIGN